MASAGAAVTVVERCAVSPPPRSVPPATLPLTFLDIPWLFFSPTQPIFFFASAAAAAAANFTQTVVPKLKHSLSLALRHFFPLAGKLVIPAALSAEPHLEYNESDSVLLVVAAAADGCEFKNLAGNHRRDGRRFRRLVPEIGGGDGGKRPVLAVQITVFPEMGICIGFTLRNVAADWRTFNNFLKNWASLCKSGGDLLDAGRHVASHDRSVILDSGGLRSFFLTEFWKMAKNVKDVNFDDSEIVRATFVLGPKEMEQIKKWILTRSDLLFGSTQLLLSPYVIVCAFIWVCWIKTHWSTNMITRKDIVHYFGFIAGGLTRMPYAVPSTYVGNCVGFGRSAAIREELAGKDGVVFAAKAIGDTVKKLNGDMLGGARNWIAEWKEMRESELHVTVTGSPKLDLYELDFGWGRPEKFEEVSIGTGAISLSESREVIGGIEVGVALPRLKMDAFSTLFNEV
ncbi:coumaroyl-CoA:anthocyanidin 3-O-glucoside-6''-O-coumaroyltransferase 2-like [Salvia miltiorrhiza]|uniref:coumaroyl-CoA:anthocyanidin 3-O-glucoside-6''-O-coumaroyltransferase 2-like n=1 Tax=Salvia miltiorrhiza TaxID=226208 RepID=UPI0025AD2774|nr:coumaroyl-CoA:anthocyanidin 3-O-glucoside-6''-O-coumaroyltransferase 2-like [Salvia miltiorrhiza]